MVTVWGQSGVHVKYQANPGGQRGGISVNYSIKVASTTWKHWGLVSLQLPEPGIDWLHLY